MGKKLFNKNLKMTEVFPIIEQSTSSTGLSPVRTGKRKALKRVYLAGPDLFRTNGIEIGIKKKKILTDLGLTPYYPGDSEFDIEDEYIKGLDSQSAGMEPTPEQLKEKTEKVAMCIAQGHEKFMRENACCAIIDCSPYRGPSMDAGTIFELGFMRALGKPCFGFTNVATNFNKRSRAFSGVKDDITDVGEDGNRFEEFNTADNLMIDNGINDSIKPFKLVVPEANIPNVCDHGTEESLALFKKCAEQIVAWNKMYAE